MSPALNLVAGGAIALLAGWVYLDAYSHPQRNGLTTFINSFYDKHSSLPRGRMVFFLGVAFVVGGVAQWCVALWKLLAQ